MWTVTISIRKNTKSGSAIQKKLKAVFGDDYRDPEKIRGRHYLQIQVGLPWQGDGSDQEDGYVKNYTQTIEPLTMAIAAALNEAGIKIVDRQIDAHRAIVGYRVEILLEDPDHYLTYYTYETESGKKKERELNKKVDAMEARLLWETLGGDNEADDNPLNFK
jgi:hypothetical protein